MITHHTAHLFHVSNLLRVPDPFLQGNGSMRYRMLHRQRDRTHLNERRHGPRVVRVGGDCAFPHSVWC